MSVKNQVATKSISDLPAGLGQPAFRALAAAGISQIAQLTTFSEAELKNMHGIGPKALKLLHQALFEQGLSFAEKR